MIKRVLASTVLMLMLQSAWAADIQVTTTEDQNGEDATKCSLREAITASNTKKAFGGCVAGERFYVDLILLYDPEKPEASNTPKVFALKAEHGELKVESDVKIRGTRALSFLKKDTWNGTEPAREALSITIKAATGARIFNTSVSRSSLSLENLILDGGTADLGGAIRAGGSVNLSRVQIKNAQATVSGGAVYLEGTASSFNANDVVLEGNVAPVGAVLSMTCVDSLVLTTRTLNFLRASVIKNGSAQSKSIVEVCGIPTGSVTASTFGANQTIQTNQSLVNADQFGAILKFRGSRQAELGNLAGNIGRVTMVGVTLTDNQGDTAFAYDDLNLFSIQNSLLAFNQRFDCAYTGNKSPELNERLSMLSNFVGGTPFTAVDARYLSTTCAVGRNNFTNTTTNIYQENSSFSDLLYPLGDYGAYTQGYLPKLAATATAKTLVDKGVVVSQCLESDQRSISRSSGFKSKAFNSSTEPRCDIGAFEYSQLTANDDNDVANTSYRAEIERKITDLTDEEVNDLPDYDREIIKFRQQEQATFVEAYKKDFTYRRAYIPILDNDVALELVDTTAAVPTSEFIQFVDGIKAGTHSVVADVAVPPNTPKALTGSLGTGRDLVGINVSSSAADIATFVAEARAENRNDDLIKCQWVGAPINKLAIWADNKNQTNFSIPYTTPSGEYERCLYKLVVKDKNGKVTEAYGIAQARITNIKPVATDDEYVLPFGAKQITLDILSNDHDEGDAPLVNGKYADYPNWPQFYKAPRLPGQPDDNRLDLPIRIVTQPVLGRLVFERQGTCPDASDTRPTETCYGGKLTYVSDNLFSKFNDEFEYEVLDANRGVSNKAVVKITNTATTTDQDKAGGGAVGSAGLLGLLGLVLLRRRMK
jgi:CSLREA domain-containing protein/MYXO-CTERM domain-containing protein